jgi:hypothetical protein
LLVNLTACDLGTESIYSADGTLQRVETIKHRFGSLTNKYIIDTGSQSDSILIFDMFDIRSEVSSYKRAVCREKENNKNKVRSEVRSEKKMSSAHFNFAYGTNTAVLEVIEKK